MSGYKVAKSRDIKTVGKKLISIYEEVLGNKDI